MECIKCKEEKAEICQKCFNEVFMRYVHESFAGTVTNRIREQIMPSIEERLNKIEEEMRLSNLFLEKLAKRRQKPISKN